MDLKGGENGRTASWLGHICRSGRHERSRHKSSAGAAPRSNHSYSIVREEDTTSGYPYGPKVSGGRRRRPDDSQTGGSAQTGADLDRGCGDCLLAPRKEQAQDPPAQQPGRFRCPGRGLLGAALRADLLRPHLRDGDRRLDGRHERRLRRHRHRRRLHRRGVREYYRGDVRALFAVEGVRLSTGLPKSSRGWISRPSKPTCPRSKKRSCARPSLCRGGARHDWFSSKAGGREQGYVEAAQKELDVQPNEEEGAAGRRERRGGAKRARSVKGRGERAARETGQKEHARGFGQEPCLNRVESRALRLEEKTRGGEDDDLYRK